MASSSEAELTLVIKAKNMATKEFAKLGNAFSKLKKGAGNLGHAILNVGKVAAVAAGAGLLAFGALLFKATTMAADEEKGIKRLNAAIRANDKHWKKNSKNVETVIAKREALAFSDDDLRNSLTILVSKYKDTNKALRLQALAMDLARLKGIPLADASNMLGKALDGNAKALKTLGIVLPKTATEHQRLMAIQKAAAGQAKAYGETAAGAQEAFQIATDDLMEDLGTALLPVMKGVFTWLRVHGLPAVRDIGAKIGDWLEKNKPLIEQLKGAFLTAVKVAADWVGKLAGMVGSLLGNIRDFWDTINTKQNSDEFNAWVKQTKERLQPLAELIGRIVRGFKELFGLQKQYNQMKGLNQDLNGVHVLSNPHNNEQGTFANTRRVPGPLGKPMRITAHGGEKISDAGPDSRTGGGFTIAGVSEREIVEMVDRGLYFKLRRAAPTAGRI